MKQIVKLGFVFAVLCIVSAAAETLRCYDCDPSHDGDKCGDPENFNARLVICNATRGETMCLSAFYIGKGDKTHKTGVYRGCFARRPDVRDQCEYFREQNQQENVNVVSCLPCTEARCNIHLFDDKGLPTNSVTKNASSVLLTFVINILIVSISLLYRS